MSPQAFPRLALVAACSAYVIGLCVVWQQLGWVTAVVALAGGTLRAIVVTIEPTAEPTDQIDVDGKPVDADFVRQLLHRRRKDPDTFENV